MPEMPEIDLSPLKDVHLPPEPLFFPPAIGWWLIMGVILTFSLLMILFFYFWKLSPKRYALRLLKKIEVQKLPLAETGVQLDVLLKRVALIAFPREKVASLSHKEWADFLIHHGNGTLSAEQADFIVSSVYLPHQKAVAISTEKLYNAIKEWICCVLKKG